MKLSKKRLLPYEYRQYKQIGEPDLSQNWLELFTPVIVSDLFEIMHSCSDNQKKAGYIREALEYYGFEEVSLGTNIYVMANPAYPGVVFKFALDDNGLADNFNDGILQEYVPRYAKTLARHPSAIVSVQERKVVVADQDRMDSFRGDILKALRKLSEDFLIVDLSPTNYHLNYGVERNGDWCFIDASDLFPLANMPDKVRCNKAVGYDDKKKKVKRCGGRLMYDTDYSHIVCTKCGSEYLPLEIRPKDKEDKGKMSNAMSDGMSFDEREEMIAEEVNAIRQSGATPVVKSETSRVSAEQDTEEPVEKPKTGRSVFVDPNEDTSDVMVFDGIPTFQGSKRPQVDDEDDEEPEDGVSRIVMACDESSEDEPATPTGDDNEPDGTFSVLNYDGANENEAGIYLDLVGDPVKALDECIIPIYVRIDGEVTQILRSDTFAKLLRPAIEEIVHEHEEEMQFRRERAAAHSEDDSDEDDEDDE